MWLFGVDAFLGGVHLMGSPGFFLDKRLGDAFGFGLDFPIAGEVFCGFLAGDKLAPVDRLGIFFSLKRNVTFYLCLCNLNATYYKKNLQFTFMKLI